MKAAILSISSDAVLLETRSLVLESAGYQPISARNIGDVVQACKQHDIAAIVICHSTPTEIQKRLTRIFRRGTPIIRLCLTSADEDLRADVFVAVADGPEALIDALRARLASSSLEQAA